MSLHRRKTRKGATKMNREQLRALGLNEEQIDAVVADHARVVQSVQTRLTAAENRATDLETQLENATNSEEIQNLTQRAETAEANVTELQGQLNQITIDGLVDTALTTAGVTDLDYARFKLGKVELSEDGKTIVDLENKVKDLKTTIPTYFKAAEPKDETGKETGTDPLDGFQRVNANPGNGQQSEANAQQAMIDAMTADLPTPK